MTRSSARAMLVVLTIVCVGCSTPTAPSDPEARGLTRSIATESFDFRYADGDQVDAGWQEAFHRWAVAQLGVRPGRIVYHKYFSRAHMQAQIGVGNTNAWADPNKYELHTIWPTDSHEVIHLYSMEWGRATALISEGFAVSYQVDPVHGDLTPRWSRVPLHERARQLLAEGRLLPLSDLLTSADFRRFDPNVTYPEAGSFMVVVREQCGLEGVRQLFRAGAFDSSAGEVRAHFTAACGGRSIEDLDAVWRTVVSGTAMPEERRDD